MCSLYYHVDTVPPGAGWSRPPLALTREGLRLYGRGTADMKGAIAATLAALRALHRTRLATRFDPVLLFCTDEEGGLYPGVRYLADIDDVVALARAILLYFSRDFGGAPGRRAERRGHDRESKP